LANARETALKILYDIEFEGAYLNIALKKHLGVSGLNDKDKGLATALVYGVVQRKISLEYFISCYSKIKVKKISKFVLIILKLGIYQILYMDKIPESAAVNESVKLAGRYSHASGKGFVNGILRNIIRNKENLPVPDEKIKAVSVKYSFPEWLLEKWINEFGEEFAFSLMESLNKDAQMTVRVNTLKTTAEKITKLLPNSRIGRFSEYCIHCSGFDVAGSELYKNGLITPQDEAAMLAAEILEPAAGDFVIDMCAAPGGKSTHMAQLMCNKGKIIAFDIHEHKIELIKENAKRMGMDIIEPIVGDSGVFDEKYKDFADKILVDAPCSGLGIIRSKPDIKWNRQQESELSDIQYKILNNAAGYLKKGGELVYSTCTLEKEENEGIIEKFLKEHTDFKAVDISKKVNKPTAKNGYITMYPNIDDTDGFFIAKLKKV